LEIVLAHIKILCGGDQDVTDYMLKWIGQAIQFPAVKTRAIFFISKEGAGKGTLIDFLRSMFGKTKVLETSTPTKHVWGQFNGLMQDAFIVNLDEISKKDTVESMGQIKALITNTAMTINRKGIDAYPIDSYHRFLSTTNKEEPIPTSEDDRRMLIIRSNDVLIGNTVYFKKVHDIFRDPDAMRTCFDYFKSIPDLENFASIPVPQTEHQTNLKELAITPLELWLKEFTLAHHEVNQVELSSADVFASYRSWCKNNMPDFKVITSQQLGVRIKNSSIVGIDRGKHTRTGETRVFDIVQLKKHFAIGDVAEEPEKEIDGL
jgi:hypothetical protein